MECPNHPVHENLRHVLSSKSPFIDLLTTALDDHGCRVTIKALRCDWPENIRAAYISQSKSIVVCSQAFDNLSRRQSRKQLEYLITHELVHAFDDCRAKVDFHGNHEHLMCTEVRAASLSGECMLKNNKLGVLLEKFTGFHEHCVKKSAIRSFMAMHPACGKEVALDVFNRVFHSCYNDFTPFDRVVLTDRQAKLAYRAYMTQYRYKL